MRWTVEIVSKVTGDVIRSEHFRTSWGAARFARRYVQPQHEDSITPMAYAFIGRRVG